MHFPQTTKVLTQASAESNVELLCGKLLLQKRPRVSQCERRSPFAREILSLPDYKGEGTRKQLHFWISVAKCDARFIKDQPVKKWCKILTCRCKHFSLKQASGLGGGGGGAGTPGSSPWIRHCATRTFIVFKKFFSYASCLYLDCELHLNWYVIKGSLGYK